ncbi:MAG TPA: choice-of-anchor J domain-containing protein [Candidatus Cloacimonadota bacterium]|nr:choice-of-anchor J domain-containing protein [Candidatus Cloacimonadota bacterium]
MKKILFFTLLFFAFSANFATALNESFEGATFPPSDWSIFNYGDANTWQRSSAASHTGLYCSSITFSLAAHDDWLITPKLCPQAGSNVLSFWAKNYSSSYIEQFNVKLSVTDNQLSSFTVTLASNISPPTDWMNYNFNLSAYNGMNIYVAVQAISANMFYLYLDDFSGVELAPTTTIPNPTTLISPLNGEMGVLETATLNWNASSGATGYKLYFGTDNPPANIINGTNLGNVLTYDPPGNMNFGMNYYWKVVPTNSNGDASDCPIWNFSVRQDPTIYNFPYIVDFENGSFLPPDWTVAEGASGAGYHWSVTQSASAHGPVSSHSGNYFAWLNCYVAYSSYNPYYLVSPPIHLDSVAKRLNYWFWIGEDSYTTPPPLFVDISTDFINWTRLYSHNRAYLNTWTQNSINLSAYSNSTVYLRFGGNSNYGSGRTDFGLDDIVIENIPTVPVFTLNPNVSFWDFGACLMQVPGTKQFTITNTGGGNLIINSVTANGNYYSISQQPADTNLTANESAVFTVQFLPAVAGGPYSGSVTVNYNLGSCVINFSGTAYEPSSLPLSEDFEGGFGNWIVANGAQTNRWNVGSATFYSGNNSAYISYNNGMSNTYMITSASSVHFYKDIRLTANAERYCLNFVWKGYGESATNDYLQVFLIDSNVIPEAGTLLTTGQLGENYNRQDTWQTATIYFSNEFAGQVKRLVFSWSNDSTFGNQPPAAVDDISLTAIMPSPPDPVTLIYPANGEIGLPITGFNFTWEPNVGSVVPDSYGVYLASSAENIYNEHYFRTSNTHYNPVTEGGIEFNYEECWFWTVVAYKDDLVSAAVIPPHNFVILPDPYLRTIPYFMDFEAYGDNTLPPRWERSTLGTAGWKIGDNLSSTTTNWIIPAHTVYAAAVNDISSDSSMDLLYAPSVDFSSYIGSQIILIFNSYFTGTGGETASVEITTNLTDWTTLYSVPPQYSWVKITIDLTPYLAAPFRLRFHANDNGFVASGWAIDDFSLSAPPVNDVGIASWDLDQEVFPEGATVIPKVTVANYASNPQSFTVTCNIGTYSDTQSVSNLIYGATQQVTFANYYPPLWNWETATVTTNLDTDQNEDNNNAEATIICVPVGDMAYASATHDPTNVINGPCRFNLKTPGSIIDLDGSSENPVNRFLSAACLIGNNWYAGEYETGNFFSINKANGAIYYLGSDLPMNGMAYDPNHDILYGLGYITSYGDIREYYLCRINPSNGTVYQLTQITGYYNNGLIIDIAYDSWNDILYAADIYYDALFIINTSTGEKVPVYGYFGHNLNYAQGMAFDPNNGLLYLAGYTNKGSLYWVDTEYGGAYKVGDFQSGTQMDAFVIPPYVFCAPDVTIDQNGVISWEAVSGASSYNIYGSDAPYENYEYVTTLPNSITHWNAPLNTSKKFWYVTSVSDTKKTNVRMSGSLRRDNVRRVEPDLKADVSTDKVKEYNPTK